MNINSLDIVIYNINELVTLKSTIGVPRIGENMNNLGLIKNGAIGIKGDKIAYVGASEEIFTIYDKNRVPNIIDASGKLVTPGFVDPHTHIVFSGSRENELPMKLSGMSYLEILKSGGGILKTVRETRKASEEELVKNGINILNRMMAYGTTTIETKSGYGLTTESELKSLRTIKILNQNHPIEVISTFLGAHAVPPEFEGKTDEYVELIVSEMLPKIAKEDLAEYCDVFCEKGIFSVEHTRRILLEAMKHGIKPQIHIDEIEDTNGALLAAELKAIQTGHLLKSNEEGLKALARSKIIATLLPGTPFCLMLKEYAPARKMIEMGIPIALATDLNPNCWTESMQMIIALACYHMKMSPAESLTAATLNAACAIDRQDVVGSVELGKKADIVIFNVPNHQFLPYHFGINHVSKVLKDGKIVIDNPND